MLRKFNNAIEKGDLQNVKKLLMIKKNVASLADGWAVRRAVINGHFREANESALSGRMHILQELLKHENAVESLADGVTVRRAVSCNRLQILQELLQYKNAVATLADGWAARNAVDNGHLQILDYILKRVKRFDNIEEIMIYITDIIARRNNRDEAHYRCLHRLLSDSKIRQWLQNQDDIPNLLKSAAFS